MAKQTSYVSKKPDAKGYVDYTADENAIWRTLTTRQLKLIENRACDDFMVGFEKLDLPHDRIPQLPDVSKTLQAATGWSVAPVPALISYDKFFGLLANCQFPVATFIRRRDELDYLEEPDIFHEIFGHCPLLTNPFYADFIKLYAQFSHQTDPQYHPMLARLYWYTIEFGLINTDKGLRNYGAGIISSIEENTYALESDIPERRPFDIIDALRTPYRIDILQTVYFVIDSLEELFTTVKEVDLCDCIHQARKLGQHPPTYPPKEDNNE